MKIQFGFDVKSINKAVETLKKAKTQLMEQMLAELLNGCCEWLKSRANWYLDLSDIGSVVKQDIQSNWQTAIINNVATLTNISDKAVFVEFGVGIVGGENEHPNADKTNYWYDLPTQHKDSRGGWRFNVDNESELDLPQSAIITQDDTYNGDLTIYTYGTKGVWYAFNALVDLKEYGAKEVWEEVKRKYWG